MNFGKWECHIERNILRNSYRLYLFKAREDGSIDTLNGKGELINVPLGAKEPEDSHFADLKDAELQAIANELDRTGKKTESTHKLEGILEAQSKHLEDMRKIISKKGLVE